MSAVPTDPGRTPRAGARTGHRRAQAPRGGPIPGRPPGPAAGPGPLPGARAPWYVREAALTALLVAVVVGMALVADDYWRRGLLGMGIPLLGAAALRLVLPARFMGSLAVRGRVFDAAWLSGLGVAIVGLTLAVPG